jgi:knotted carbamoyltransferase YgeW
MMSSSEVRETLQRLDPARLESLLGRSLLLTSEWSSDEIETVLDLADAFHALDGAGIATPLLPNELNCALFFDASTRTKSSWAGASVRLGSHPVIMDGSSTQVSHGETAEETGAMLGMNSHALGFRHDLILGEGNIFMHDARRGVNEYLKATQDPRVVPIVNLQCDVDHPTQTLADLAWLRQRFPEGVAGKTLAMTWAYSPSYAKPLSVPQGLVSLLPRFGMHVRLAHPEGYDLIPEVLETALEDAAAGGGSLQVVADMDEAFADADAVYPKSWGPYDLMLERVGANRMKDAERMQQIEAQALARNLDHQDWICDERRMASTRDGAAVYMHCLPADVGDEVTAGVMEKARIDLARQANNKVYVIMALLAAAKADGLRDRLLALV